jgi:hypothetical protein
MIDETSKGKNCVSNYNGGGGVEEAFGERGKSSSFLHNSDKRFIPRRNFKIVQTYIGAFFSFAPPSRPTNRIPSDSFHVGRPLEHGVKFKELVISRSFATRMT